MADPNVTIVAQAADGSPYVIAAYDAPNKTPWFAVRTYDIRDGAGCFFSFQARDAGGKWYDAVLLNGGFWLDAANKPSSDLDIIGYSEGKQFWIAIAGAGQGDPAALSFGPNEVVALGTKGGRALELWLKEYPPRSGMPANVRRCVKVNGGYVPIYE